jgi:hypothetical protein
MLRLMDEYGVKWTQYGAIKNMAKICQKKPRTCDKVKDIREEDIIIEGFGNQSNRKMVTFVLSLVLLFLLWLSI